MGYIKGCMQFILGDVPFKSKVTGIVPDEFQIDAWCPLLLEIPEGGSKASFSGRFPSLAPVKWGKDI